MTAKKTAPSAAPADDMVAAVRLDEARAATPHSAAVVAKVKPPLTTRKPIVHEEPIDADISDADHMQWKAMPTPSTHRPPTRSATRPR